MAVVFFVQIDLCSYYNWVYTYYGDPDILVFSGVCVCFVACFFYLKKKLTFV